MKKEIIKSIVLASLVFCSLLLTLGIWNYQPNLDSLNNTTYLNETKIGGEEETKSGLIEPENIIFHRSGGFFAMETKAQTVELYHQMQEWRLTNVDGQMSKGEIPEGTIKAEVIFPDELPAELVKDLFTIEQEAVLPLGSFDRMYILLNEESSSLRVQFYDTSSKQKFEASVQNAEYYQQLVSYINDTGNQDEYIVFNQDKSPNLYLTKGKVELAPMTYQATKISVDPLVNVLFSDPSVVRESSTTTGGKLYTDGSRELRIYPDGKGMQLINLSKPEVAMQRQPIELINQSLAFTNDHLGWTDEYNLSEMTGNTVRYRLYNNHYPVFDNSGLTYIEQEFRNLDIYEYSRPLIQLKTKLAEPQKQTLVSGEDVITYIETVDQIPMDAVTDIAVGYKLEAEKSYEIYSLKPAWFVRYNGEWKELTFENKGGEGDAMGPN